MSVVPPAIPPVQPRRSRACLWIGGGCALAVVLLIAMAAFGGIAVYNYFRQTGLNCLPADFPAYPGVGPGAYNYELNGTVPGNSCNMVFHSKDGYSAVLDFYESRLATGGWHVTSSNRDVGLIAFRKVNSAKTNGTVQVAAKDGYTEITVQLYSP